jgi:hypothetical protein
MGTGLSMEKAEFTLNKTVAIFLTWWCIRVCETVSTESLDGNPLLTAASSLSSLSDSLLLLLFATVTFCSGDDRLLRFWYSILQIQIVIRR